MPLMVSGQCCKEGTPSNPIHANNNKFGLSFGQNDLIDTTGDSFATADTTHSSFTLENQNAKPRQSSVTGNIATAQMMIIGKIFKSIYFLLR